jgi:hypothetical protein
MTYDVSVITEPEPTTRRLSPYGTVGAPLFGRGGSDDPFVILAGEEAPPEGIQAAEDLWAVVTLGGNPVAFVSPEVVSGLDPDLPVGATFDDLRSAYVADFVRQPRDFFRQWLSRQVRGRVVILDRRYAERRSSRIAVTALEDAQCDLGQILPIGEICDASCRCSRRRQQ